MQLSTETMRQRLSRFMVERRTRKLAAQPPRRRLTTKQAAVARDKTWQDTIRAELSAIDSRADEIEAELARAAGDSYRGREMRQELTELPRLRAAIEQDRDHPLRLDDRQRRFREFRTAELREHKSAAAARADAEGDPRRARELRYDGLRARQIAELEMALRRTLPGY